MLWVITTVAFYWLGIPIWAALEATPLSWGTIFVIPLLALLFVMNIG
jgi:hypothetical protein